MNREMTDECPWTERVSALVDNELPMNERELVVAHTTACATCHRLYTVGQQLVTTSCSSVTALVDALPNRLPPALRVVLAVVGASILIGSLPDFVRGNTMGNALHDLRHLAIWQASIGVAVCTTAFTFRMSRLITVMLTTFLGLSAGAVAYDLLTSHRGPWTDPTHIIEVIAVVLVLRLTWPHVRLTARHVSPSP